MSGAQAASGPASPAAPALLPEKFVVRVATDGDWHVGSGMGLPGVDALIRRDADRLPYVPGATLTGVLRDACEQVAYGLDGAPAGRWRAWVVHLFGARPREDGRTTRAALSVRPGFASEGLRTALHGRGALLDATVFLKPGVKIDGTTGRAQDSMLRTVEVARGGIALHARAWLRGKLTEDQLRAATVLLVLGAAWLRRLGADRSRGTGRVRVGFVPVDADQPGAGNEAVSVDGETVEAAWRRWVADCAAWARTETPAAPPSTPYGHDRGETAADTAGMAARFADTAWRRIPLTITTLAPVRVPAATLGNRISTRPAVPGTVLLAWLLRKLPDESGLRDAFLGGDAVVTDANPRVGGGRGLPFPLALGSVKHGDPLQLQNLLLMSEPTGDDTGQDDGGKQVKPVRPGAFTGPCQPGGPDGDPPGVCRHRIMPFVATHNVATPLAGRPTTLDGGVYTVEAIPAGTVLHADLLVRTGVLDAMSPDAASFASLSGRATWGARGGSEYGAVQVDVGPSEIVSSTGTRIVGAGETLTLWAVSDVLVRDRLLRLSGDPADVVRAVEDAAHAFAPDVRLAPVGRVAAANRIESWQGGWGLPRPTLVAVAAGSCLSVEVTAGRLEVAELEGALIGGVGERRAEGFGRLVCDPPLLAHAVLHEAAEPASDQGVPPVRPTRLAADPADGEYVALVRRAAQPAAIAAAIRELARVVPPPSAFASVRTALTGALTGLGPSQRGALRAAASAVRTAGSEAPLHDYREERARKEVYRPIVDALAARATDGAVADVLAAAGRLLGGEPPEPDAAARDARAMLVLDALEETEPPPALEAADHGAPASGRPARGPASRAPAVRRRKTFTPGNQRSTSADGADTAVRDARFRAVHTRYTLQLPLVARTPLHIGGMHADPYVDLTIAVDGRGRRHVPGSSLAGAARARWERLFGSERTAKIWDGRARLVSWSADKPAEELLASLVEVADAPLTGRYGADVDRTEVRDGVGIDRATGAAAPRIKYDREVIPAGVRLVLRMAFDDCEEPAAGGSSPVRDEVVRFADDLVEHGLMVGAALTRGLGRLAACGQARLTAHRTDTRGGIIDAVLDAAAPARPREPGAAEPGPLGKQVWSRTVTGAVSADAGPPPDTLRITVTWRPETPLLVGAATGGGGPLHPLVSAHPVSGDPVPVLPGAGVKGVFSTEIGRMLNTLYPAALGGGVRGAPERGGGDGGKQRAAAAADRAPGVGAQRFTAYLRAMAAAFPPFAALFGTQEQAGALSIRDTFAAAPSGAAAVSWGDWEALLAAVRGHGPDRDARRRQAVARIPWLHEVTRTAIDRWTGGAAERLLFTTLEPWGLEWQPLVLDVDLRRLTAALTPAKVPEELTADQVGRRRAVAAVALVLSAVAAFADGRVPLGHGGNRGLGQVRATRVTIRQGTGDFASAPFAEPVTADTGGPHTDHRARVLACAKRLCEQAGLSEPGHSWTEYLVSAAVAAAGEE